MKIKNHSTGLSLHTVLGTVFSILSLVTVCTSQGVQRVSDLSGHVVVYIGRQSYYLTRDAKPFEKIEIPSETGNIFRDERYKRLAAQKDSIESTAIEKGRKKILSLGNRFGFSSFKRHNFTVNPTVEYAIQIGHESLVRFYDDALGDTVDVDIDRWYSTTKVFNLDTGDSIEVGTSNLATPLHAIRYAWSPDGKWLAISKENSTGGKMTYFVTVVNLPKKEIRQFEINKPYIENIVWDPNSCEVSVLTLESVNAFHILSLLLIPLGRPYQEFNYDLSIIKIQSGQTIEIPVVHGTRETSVGLFWEK